MLQTKEQVMSLSTTIISEINAEPMDSSDIGGGAAQLTEDDQHHLMEFLEQTLYAELKAEGIVFPRGQRSTRP